jgi:hypothetical protein
MPLYVFGSCRTAREAIAQFKEGQLQRVGTPTREDRHSKGQA